MSMKIKIDKDTNKTVYYSGEVSYPDLTTHGVYRFTVCFYQFGNHREIDCFDDVVWEETPKEPKKAEDRIKNLITKIMETDNELD
tara:strand:- start:1262 stop:1516 length:255 start_codon:yes stop_codon:yes gene_type:complete